MPRTISAVVFMDTDRDNTIACALGAQLHSGLLDDPALISGLFHVAVVFGDDLTESSVVEGFGYVFEAGYVDEGWFIVMIPFAFGFHRSE